MTSAARPCALRRAYVNLGANLGSPRTAITRAMQMICASPWCTAPLRSPFMESRPWGFSSPHIFVNAGLSFLTALEPLPLLEALEQVQEAISAAPHRHPDGSYADRLIDIDLIALEGVAMDTPRLTLPHPRAALRPFVMLPLIATLPPLN